MGMHYTVRRAKSSHADFSFFMPTGNSLKRLAAQLKLLFMSPTKLDCTIYIIAFIIRPMMELLCIELAYIENASMLQHADLC